jgi:hypothetical protein
MLIIYNLISVKCVRLEKTCEYPVRVRNALEKASQAGESTVSLNHNEDGLEETTNSPGPHVPGANGFTPMYFLDPEEATPVPWNSPGEPGILPVEVFKRLDPSTELESVCDAYFFTIHTWLPLLSRKIIRRTVSEAKFQKDSNFALLVLCLKLTTETPAEDGSATAASSSYLLAKECILKVELSCLPSLTLLQSAILIATYELLQGIYPAAYLSIGHAARLGTMMGLHDREHSSQMFKDPGTWTGREEERRAWWAVVILERYVFQPCRQELSG